MKSKQSLPVKRALISVSDKTSIIDFAIALSNKGVELLSTGGTAKLLSDNNIPVIEVSEYTGFPEMMGGRVKTLHPKIHGGLLGRRQLDAADMEKHGIQAIDLLIVNLYPFQKTIAQPDCDLEQAIENIDIGGPAMLRSAAKNHDSVSVLVDSADYATILNELDQNHGQISYATRFQLAGKAFAHTAGYDNAIAHYLGNLQNNEAQSKFPNTLNLQFKKLQDMRYGENPHQQAAFYTETNIQEPSIVTAKQIQGKALSYNNVADTDAALECVKQFAQPACVIVKHANPCGVAVSDTLSAAYDLAFKTDPTSAFGGIIALNRCLDADTAKLITDRQFVEVIIAPEVSQEAINILQPKKNIRLLESGYWSGQHPSYDLKRVTGGLLIQDRDTGVISEVELETVTKRQPTHGELKDLIFAWKVVKYVKSNAIVYAKNETTIGIGAGQMSRVYSAKIANIKAQDQQLEVQGSVMASDAFFPFRDGIDVANDSGIKAIIQPGGSVRDEEVIQAADEYQIAMVFTKMRHFKH